VKTVIILQEGTDGGAESLGRAVHALLYAQELHENGAEVKLILDGAGTKWVGEFENPDFKYHALYKSVKKSGLVADVCPYCCDAYGVQDAVKTSQLPQIGAYKGHPSLAELLKQGFTPIVL
jgi:hypothetical protein